MKLIVGFGNPGEKFTNNRRNIGFKVIEILGNNVDINVRVKKKKSIIGRGKMFNEDVVLLKPQTFVNLIGESVLYIASFLRINAKDIICIFEDSTLDLGEMRVDYVYSTLKNEGIESMEKALKSDRFAKIRVGVGSPDDGMTMEDHLHQDFTPEENFIVIDILNKAEKIVKMLFTHSIEDVQEKYNPEGAVKLRRRTVKVVKIDHKNIEEDQHQPT